MSHWSCDISWNWTGSTLAHIGPSSTKLGATQDCHVGLHNVWLAGIAANQCGRIGLQCRCYGLANETKLAHSSLEIIRRKHSCGPISCTVIFAQLAHIGPSSTKLGAAQDCYVGLHNVQLAGIAADQCGCIGLQCRCHGLDDETELAHSSLKALVLDALLWAHFICCDIWTISLHWPIAAWK